MHIKQERAPPHNTIRTITSMSRSGRKGSYTNYKSYGYSGGGYSGGGYKDADFIGIEWEPAYPGKFNNNTVYKPFENFDLPFIPEALGNALEDKFAVQFQIEEDQFDVAAAYSLDGLANDELALLVGEAIGLDISTIEAFALINQNYDVVAAVELEGYAKEGYHDGYARNFIVGDDIEAYVALINDNGTPTYHGDDSQALGIAVDVELTKKGANKFDALFDGGRNIGNALSMLQSMSSSQLNKFVEEIEITIDVDSTDPLIPVLGDALSQLAPALAGFGDAFAGIDIEVEFGSVEPSKWAHEAIHELLATVNETHTV